MASAAASSSASRPFPFRLFPVDYVVLTQPEINSFHTVDRTLYSRLVINLRRDPAGSAQVMALWIWLERAGYHHGTLIASMNGFTDGFLSALADEAVTCLRYLERDDLPPENDIKSLPLTQGVTQIALSVRSFHAQRAEIVEAIRKIMEEVCLKVFSDIMRQAIQFQASPNPNLNNYQNQNPSNIVYTRNPSNQHGPFYNPVTHPVMPVMYQPGTVPILSPPAPSGISPSSSNSQPFVMPYFIKEGGYLDLLLGPLSGSPRDIEGHREFLNNEITDVLNRMRVEDPSAGDGRGKDEVPPDERTIFLTFSKGYPLSEAEVAEFFTRRYGDICEAIHMQEVTSRDEQQLYARLVVRSTSAIPMVLGGKAKAKFSINGKHVWARKYVRRAGPPRSPPPPG